MKLSAGIFAIALLAFGTLIPGSAKAKTGNTLVEEEVNKEIEKYVEARYTDLIRKCLKREDYSCVALPNPNWDNFNFDKFKRECNILVAYTPDDIIISSGYLNQTMKEDNYYIGTGISPALDTSEKEQPIDIILFGVRRPKAGKGSRDDEPFFGFAPEMTRKMKEYKRLDFFHNIFDKSLSKIKPFLEKNHPDGPVTHMINLKKIGTAGLIKFKADLGKNKFAIPKKVLEKVPEWKNVDNLNWINVTEPYYNIQVWGFYDGKTFHHPTRLSGFGFTHDKIPLTRDNRQKDVKIDPSYYMPDGSLKQP